MNDPNPDNTLLLIRCPSCGQRFKVGEDLLGRTVECGACEHRFRIHDDVIVRGKKFYPGERRDPKLDGFQRVPLAEAPETSALPVMRYADAPSLVSFEPVSPQRVFAGLIGVGCMAFMGLLLMFGANRGAALDGMTTENRLLMAGFTGLMGTALLIYANPRARRKAFAVGLLFSAGLVALPFFFTEGSVPLRNRMTESAVPAQEVEVARAVSQPESELRNLIGTAPLVSEIERLARGGSPKKAVGLWLRDLREQNRFLVRDYILRTTGADPQSHYYPRGNGDFLMVVTGIDGSLDEVAKIASALGNVENTYPEISVVEVRVNNESFVEGSIEKLNNRGDPAFYDLNKRELESVDLTRVSKAVKRLAEAEPKLYRSDITRKLLELLALRWVDFKGDVCRALAVWSEKPGPAGDAALKEAKELLAAQEEIPREMIALLVKEKNEGVVLVLDELWSRNPTHWESLYGDVGQAAESSLLRRFPDTQGMVRQSAVRLLGRVGGVGSLPLLEAATVGADPELRVLLDNAATSIRGRIAP